MKDIPVRWAGEEVASILERHDASLAQKSAVAAHVAEYVAAFVRIVTVEINGDTSRPQFRRVGSEDVLKALHRLGFRKYHNQVKRKLETTESTKEDEDDVEEEEEEAVAQGKQARKRTKRVESTAAIVQKRELRNKAKKQKRKLDKLSQEELDALALEQETLFSASAAKLEH